MNFSAVLKTASGKEPNAVVTEKKLGNGVTAVYVNGKADEKLDMDFGARCKIEFDKDVDKCICIHRHSEYWCMPIFKDDYHEIPDETQGFVAKHADGKYTVILPVVSEFYKCVLTSIPETKEFCARLFSYVETLDECNALAFVYGETDNPYKMMNNCFREAIKELGIPTKMLEERDYPEMFEYLGWCSWDALQIRVSEDGLLEKCREFKEKNIPVRWAIIDDMWADIPKFRTETYASRQEMFKLMHSSPIASFEADPVRFPYGLKHAIGEMKKYMTWVGMWHPTTGYWFGVDPESKLYDELKDDLFLTEDGRYVPRPDYEGFYRFFDSFHTFLEDCGTDFVKVDNQSMTRRYYKKTHPVGQVARFQHTALEDSTTKHFGNRLINCMGCASDNVWNRPSSPVSRCSDDFQPENRDWFTKHILQCSYMSLLQGQIISCDWDMWWTDDEQGSKNSLLRAISGGPIYVSDEIGRSRRELLMPLCLDDGKILRCDKPATPTLDSMFDAPEHSGKIFKVQNTLKGSGAIAAFNLNSDNSSAKGTISPDDIEGLCGEEFAVYEHFAHKFYTMKKGERFEVEFKDRDDFRLYTFTPIVNGFAAIGRTDKFMSPLTVKSVDGKKIELFESGKCAYYDNGKFVEEEI